MEKEVITAAREYHQKSGKNAICPIKDGDVQLRGSRRDSSMEMVTKRRKNRRWKKSLGNFCNIEGEWGAGNEKTQRNKLKQKAQESSSHQRRP